MTLVLRNSNCENTFLQLLVKFGFSNLPHKPAYFLKMPSTRSKKAKARRSREADTLSDIENMDDMLGSGEYNPIERDIDQMTGFSIILNRDDNEEGHSLRGNSSKDHEIRNMPGNRNNHNLSRDLNMLSGEMENAISSAISERIILQVQGVVETILNRQLEKVQPLSRRPRTTIGDENNVDESNLQNRSSRSRQNLIESEDESPFTWLLLIPSIFVHHSPMLVHNSLTTL